MKHKWASVICAWAMGEPIQFRRIVNDQREFFYKQEPWHDFDDGPSYGYIPAFDADIYEWRTKPDTISSEVKFRLALCKINKEYLVISVMEPKISSFEKSCDFLCWLNDEQTVRFEENTKTAEISFM